MGNDWRWTLAIPWVIGTFCLCAIETYERGSFDPVGVPYQAALMAALLFVPAVVLVQFVRTKLARASVIAVLSIAPLLGLVRTVQSTATGIDAFQHFLMLVLVLGIGAAIIAVGAEIILRPDDHPLVRRLARTTFGSIVGSTATTTGFWRAED